MEKLAISSSNLPENLAETPLRDMIYAYLEEIDENEKALEIYEYFNKEILVKHTTSCFTYIVNKR